MIIKDLEKAMGTFGKTHSFKQVSSHGTSPLSQQPESLRCPGSETDNPTRRCILPTPKSPFRCISARTTQPCGHLLLTMPPLAMLS